MKVAIPRYVELVAPCFEYSATIAVFTIERHNVVDQVDFTLQSRLAMDRVRLLLDQGIDTLICGGVQDRYEDLIRATGIHVISWVSGGVDALLESFLRGTLETGRRTDPRPARPGPVEQTSANP